MQKINLSIDVSKIDKNKIIEKKYKDKNGQEVVQKIYKMVVVPLKEKKFLAQSDKWLVYKTHFVAEHQTAEDRAKDLPTNYIGEGLDFEPASVVDKDKEYNSF